MELRDALISRRTTNGAFRPDPVTIEHQRRLLEAASLAPSHFNSQPWRFVVIEDPSTIAAIADMSGASMTRLMEEGTFWKRYRRYFRFSEDEMERTGDGIWFDRLPRALRPFRRHVFGDTGQAVMNRLGVPQTLGSDNRRLVAESPLLLGVLLDRGEYRVGELSGFYSVFGLGAAMENLWLTTTELGLGIQFISTPMEFADTWTDVQRLLHVPDSLELMALYRLGYLPLHDERPSIDWSSRQRKRYRQFVFRERCDRVDTQLDAIVGDPV